MEYSVEAIKEAARIRGEAMVALPRDGLRDFIESVTVGKQEAINKELFYVLDLGAPVSLMERWNKALPTVHPFYPIKCNPKPCFVAALAALGAHFDCASQREIQDVLSLGVSPDRILFANTCKSESHIRYAMSVGVNLTTFDSVYEVKKIRRLHPHCALLLRIKAPDDSKSKLQLGTKFGALPEEVEPLLEAAKSAQLSVVGVSFHVGSINTCPDAYESAIALARKVFDTAAELGMAKMKILDLGGGFVAGPDFESSAQTIKKAIQAHFPNEPNLTIIAEPGRYFAATCFTIVACIIGKRVRGQLREYWIGDGVHGSFHHVYGHDGMDPIPLTATENPTCKGMRTYSSTVFGPTCDSLDLVVKDYHLPELELNDWLIFRNMGAYTYAMGTNFNGFYTSEIPTYLVTCSN